MSETKLAYLLLGSNLGDRMEHLHTACAQLAVIAGPIQKISSVYETEPWGYESEQSFYNQVIVVETELPPGKLMQACLAVERKMGRKRRGGLSDRKIDIDILLMDQQIVRQKHCVIPHPRLHLRKFALIPLAEVAPDLVHPELELPIHQILELVQDPLKVKSIESLSKKT